MRDKEIANAIKLYGLKNNNNRSTNVWIGFENRIVRLLKTKRNKKQEPILHITHTYSTAQRTGFAVRQIVAFLVLFNNQIQHMDFMFNTFTRHYHTISTFSCFSLFVSFSFRSLLIRISFENCTEQCTYSLASLTD